MDPAAGEVCDGDSDLRAGGLVDVEVEVSDCTPVLGPRLSAKLDVNHSKVEDTSELRVRHSQLGFTLLPRRLLQQRDIKDGLCQQTAGAVKDW